MNKTYPDMRLEISLEIFSLNLFIFVKQVLTTYLNHSQVHFLELTSTGVI